TTRRCAGCATTRRRTWTRRRGWCCTCISGWGRWRESSWGKYVICLFTPAKTANDIFAPRQGDPTMPRGLLLCDDLIFTSKVTGVAKALGLDVTAARDSSALLRLARQEAPSCVLIDLHNPGLDLAALLAALKEACPAMPRVVAYGSHVEAAAL